MAIIEFQEVSFQYTGGIPAVDRVSFSVDEGSSIAIIGQNGAGKTTTVKMMNGLLKPSKGKNSSALQSPTTARQRTGM